MTEFIETRAFLLALESGESDELEEYLVEYLVEHFLPNELEGLGRACRALSWCASNARQELDRRATAGEGEQ